MRIYERIDEDDNLMGWYATTEPACGEIIKEPAMSYLGARRKWESLGEYMGLGSESPEPLRRWER